MTTRHLVALAAAILTAGAPARARDRYQIDVRILHLDAVDIQVDGVAEPPTPLGALRCHGAVKVLRAGGKEVTADGTAGILVNGETAPPTMIAAPRVALNSGEDAQIMSGRALQYFEKQPDGSYALRVTDQDDSPTFRLRIVPRPEVADSPDGRVAVSGAMMLRLLTGRQPIAGVSLDVGKPVLLRSEFPVQFVADLDVWTMLSASVTRATVSREAPSNLDDRELLVLFTRISKLP